GEAVHAVGNDRLPGGEAGRDHRVLAVARAERDLVHGDGLVRIDEIDEVAGRAALHRRRRYEHGLLQRVHQQAYVDEFVRVQRFVVVVEGRAQGDRTGGRGHLV